MAPPCTEYRGRRLTLAQLGGAQESAVVTLPRPPHPPPSTSRRIRILSKNVGGLCTSTHDVFMNWLTSARNPYDVVFLQETHHELDRAFTEYKVPGWTVISSPDPSHRWAGVALYISERLASHLDVRFQELIPGRLLHARIPVGCHKQNLHLDLINIYQWAWDTDASKQRSAKRQEVWQRLNRLLTTLPARNAKCVAGDLNCTPSTDGQHVGPSTYRGAAYDAQQALIAGRMCALNTWSSKRRSATYM